MMRFALSLSALYFFCVRDASAGAPADKDAPILATLEKLANAYNAGNAKGIAVLWSEKAEYHTEGTGELLEGRAAIEADFAELFSGKRKARLEIDVDRIRRIRPDVASVEGSARVIRVGEGVRRTRFVALLVKSETGWLLDSVRESAVREPDSNQEHLKELGWLNGTWKHSEKGTEIVMTCDWVANGNFRSHRFTVKRDGEVVHQGTQIIGWDPVKKQIRSWVFSSDGSFGEGVWKKVGKGWEAKVVGVLPDGDSAIATQVLTRLDDDHFIWQSVDRSVGDRLLPNVDVIAYGRIETKAEPKKGE